MRDRLLRRRARLLLVGALTLAALGCSKDAARGADAGDAAPLTDAADGGDGGTRSDAGAGADDTSLPSGGEEELAGRMKHLVEALAQNNPDLAGDVLFPRDAFVAVKDVADPQKAWEKKVSNAFRRSIERLNKRTKGVDHAKFVSFELGKNVTQLTPKKKDFKKPLWRVKHSKLSFSIDGKIHHLVIAEMTAWRGAWYITRVR